MKIADILIDGGTQIRRNIDYDIVEEYRNSMLDGAKFPPIVVFCDGANNWLVDGFHRLFAAKDAELKEIDVDVRHGSKREAVLFAVGANSEHGLRRTNEDKREAVVTLLSDDEWQKWSDREIARRCCVSNHLVTRIRNQLNLTGTNPSDKKTPEKSAVKKYTNKHGNETTMQTKNIGKSQPVTNQPKTQPKEKTQKEVIDIGYYSDIIMNAIFSIDGERALNELRKATIGFFNDQLNHIKKGRKWKE